MRLPGSQPARELSLSIAEGEVVSGIKTNRYQVTGADFTTADNEQVSGEVWVAQSGGMVVQAIGQAEADLNVYPVDCAVECDDGRERWKAAVNAEQTSKAPGAIEVPLALADG